MFLLYRHFKIFPVLKIFLSDGDSYKTGRDILGSSDVMHRTGFIFEKLFSYSNVEGEMLDTILNSLTRT